MSNRTCESCGGIFKSVQGLIKHKSRKIPCTESVNSTCEKCGKKFKDIYSLNRHFNRKTPCVKKKVNSFNDQKELINLQTESEIKILEKKKEIIEFQYEKKKEIRKEAIELQYEKKKEIQKEVIELQYEKKKELMELQKEKELAVEEKKSKRKVAVSNQTIINNIVQQVNINMPAAGKIPATYDNCIDEIVKPFISRIERGSYSTYELVYESSLTKAELATHIIQDVFRNDALPSNQNIIYITELDLFMVVLHKAWVYKQFAYIANIMTETFKLCFLAIKARIGRPIRGNFLSDKIYEKAVKKYAEVEELANISITAEELERISKDGLNIDDILFGKKPILME